MQKLVETFIATANAFDVEGTLSLVAPDAIIDDVSVGDAFVGRDGIRIYFERFFVGYNTASSLLSIKTLNDFNANVRLDFTGDFGHEIGILKIAINAKGLIERIDADLEWQAHFTISSRQRTSAPEARMPGKAYIRKPPHKKEYVS